jgi:YD repeat-containing protein
LALALCLAVGCDWSAGGSDDGFNTSQGAGISVNLSGVYHGSLGGGRAVAQTSGPGAITRLTINQAGNTVEVTDNQGSSYRGTVGAPGAVSSANDSGVYPAGAELVQAQINFSGKDEVAQRDIEFVGVVHVVAVTDIQGTKTETEDVSTFGETTGGTNVVVETDQFGNPISATTNVTPVETRDIETTVTTTIEYQITEANSQYRLEGTWIETDGNSSAVDALSAGTSGVITETDTTTETTTE